MSVTDDALRAVVADYTREAGVRNLERELGKLLRKTAARIAAGAATPPITIDVDDVQPALGRAKFHGEAAERTGVPGVATGLAVTGVGGDVLFVEATDDGRRGPDPHRSARRRDEGVGADRAVVRAGPRERARRRAGERAATRCTCTSPPAAIPKDGPSAGVTMTTALVSLLTGRPVKAGVGMTGEVTLQGRVLPIGGVKQKVLAAHRAGLDTVILPQRNGPDLDDVPEAVRDVMTFHLVDDVRDVLALALEDAPVESQIAA